MGEPAAEAFAAIVARVEAAPTAHRAAEELINGVSRLIRARAGEPAGLVAFANLLELEAEPLAETIGEASWRAALREREKLRPVAGRSRVERRDSSWMFRRIEPDGRG